MKMYPIFDSGIGEIFPSRCAGRAIWNAFAVDFAQIKRDPSREHRQLLPPKNMIDTKDQNVSMRLDELAQKKLVKQNNKKNKT